jgi:hypothetical protein
MELISTRNKFYEKKYIEMEFPVPCLTIHEVLLNVHAHIILSILRAHARCAFSCSKKSNDTARYTGYEFANLLPNAVDDGDDFLFLFLANDAYR